MLGRCIHSYSSRFVVSTIIRSKRTNFTPPTKTWMSTMSSPQNQREPGVSDVKVIEIEELSANVKLFSLQVPKKFTFEAGQWLDVFIPGLDQIGGFSLANGPHHTTNPSHPAKTLVQMAIKLSPNPPAKWMHENISVGSELGIRAGGDTVLIEEPQSPAVFIAGGIGVAPLHSMLQERLAWLGESPPVETPTLLLYSVKSLDDLLFIDSLSNLARVNPNFNVRIYVSGDTLMDQVAYCGFPVIPGRINESAVKEALDSSAISTQSTPHAYLCGPPNMVESTKSILQSLKAVPDERIHYERWW